jgi:hypothetical protein
MKPPYTGEPEEFEHTSETIVPLMVAGWVQCEPPETKPAEEKKD